MTAPARETPRGRPRLTIVQGARSPLPADSEARWRRAAHAVLGCTQELVQHILDQRWTKVAEVMRERRELLAWLADLPLDAEGRGCLRALTQSADESEAVIAKMLGAHTPRQ
jgi:hypothetical protein